MSLFLSVANLSISVFGSDQFVIVFMPVEWFFPCSYFLVSLKMVQKLQLIHASVNQNQILIILRSTSPSELVLSLFSGSNQNSCQFDFKAFLKCLFVFQLCEGKDTVKLRLMLATIYIHDAFIKLSQ